MSEKLFEIIKYGSDYYIEIIDHEKELDESIDNPSQRLDLAECADLLNELSEDNRQLKEKNEQLKKSEKINIEYAEQIVEENQKLRIAKNDLRIENEQLRQFINKGRRLSVKELIDNTNENELLKKKIMGLELENENLRKQVESSETTSNATSNYNAHLESKISTLEKENEKLREELSDCEKFRHSVFKRIEKTIEDKDNCILNKAAKYPCKAYDECLKRQGTNKPLPCVVNWMMSRSFKNMLKGGNDD